MAMLNRQNILTSSDAHTQNLFKGQRDGLVGEGGQERFYSSISKDMAPRGARSAQNCPKDSFNTS